MIKDYFKRQAKKGADLKAPTMLYARDARTLERVYFPGDHLGGFVDAEWVLYDEKIHKRNLICDDCTAEVHFCHAVPYKGGDNLPGSCAHFATNPGQVHDAHDCEVGFINAQLPPKDPKPEIDKTLGYRLNLNRFQPDSEAGKAFARWASGPYTRESSTKTRFKEGAEDLRRMQTYSADCVADLVKFMRNKDPQRVAKSLVIHKGFEIPWDEFLITYNDASLLEERDTHFKNLVQTMIDKKQTYRPVLMQMIVHTDVPLKHFEERRAISSKPVLVSRDDKTHAPTWILPRVYIDMEDAGTHRDFAEKGSYLALGYLRLTSVVEASETHHNLFLSVKDINQITKADPNQIGAENAVIRKNKDSSKKSPFPSPNAA